LVEGGRVSAPMHSHDIGIIFVGTLPVIWAR